MSNELDVSISRGLPETVLPPVPPEWLKELDAASIDPDRHVALSRVAGRHPRMLEAWAALCEETTDEVAAYAYAHVGYHRGLDALRAAGWRGTGFVRSIHETNRGFLRCLDGLRRAAAAIGETEEEERCRVFLAQLDPHWGRTKKA